MHIEFQLLLLLLFSVIACSFFKKWIKMIASFILAKVFTLELASVYLSGSLIDYKFYEHMNLTDVWSLKDFYAKEFFFFFVFFILVTFLIYSISKSICKSKLNTTFKAITIVVTLIGMLLSGGILNNLYQIAHLKLANSTSFKEALETVSIDPNTYKQPSEITATPGKNIIVISLESLERGYLEPPFNKLTPNLQNLKKEYTYRDLYQNEGNGWTSASMYGTLSGLPAFFKSSGNETFQNAYKSKITSLATVLKKANYDLTYLLGNKEFSGISDMLNLHGFTVKSEKDFDTKYPKTNWGIHDQDLFVEAQKETLKKSKAGKPFALFISTISGHFPDGVYDERLVGKFPEAASNIEYMARAVDHFVGNFMEFLKKEGLTENTVVYIFPDHKLMGNSSPVINKFQNRGLYLITTAKEDNFNINPNFKLYQIDLPRLILDGAQVKTNATFLSDYIKEQDKNDFITANKAKFVSLNESSLITGDFKGGITLSRKQNNTLTLASKNSGYNTEIGPIKENKLYAAIFDSEMRFTKWLEVSKKNAFVDSKNTRLVFSQINGELFTYIKRGEFIGISKRSEKSITFNKEDLSLFDDWAILLPEIKPDIKMLTVKSSGFNAFKTHGKSQIYLGLTPYQPSRGITLTSFENDQANNVTYDTFANDKDVENLITRLTQLVNNKSTFTLTVHDSAEEALLKEKKAFKSLGFEKLSSLKTREAYIAYYTDGKLLEFKNPNSITKIFPLPRTGQIDKSAIAKDPARYIAHAGGRIDGINYTNSLEALNNSYTNNLKYFELDIIKTSDGKFVAAHDWNIWKQHTGFTGTTPVTQQEFLKHKIKGKYTPLTMKRINTWFKKHPDAILVTDKVNTPKEFAHQFVDKSRLMMELFTLNAVKEAQNLGLKSYMPSENVVNGLGANTVEQLQDLGVQHIAISRKSISKRAILLDKLKRAGIKTYVYHVNFEKGKDEQYVFDYEMDYIFGMYVDSWKIN